jgi:hypothetical protein
MGVYPDSVADRLRRGPSQNANPRKVRLLALIAILGIAAVAVLWYYYGAARKIPAAGGLYFFSRLELPVHRFAQDDPRWSDDPLGPTQATMGAEGCAVSSSAMVLAFYGQDVDPGRLNAFLTMNGGFTPEGWLYWEKAADYVPGTVRHAYEDLPSYFLIDSNLLGGNPVTWFRILPPAENLGCIRCGNWRMKLMRSDSTREFERSNPAFLPPLILFISFRMSCHAQSCSLPRGLMKVLRS